MNHRVRAFLAAFGAAAVAMSALGQLAAPRPGDAPVEKVRYDGHRVVRVHIRTEKDLEAALALTDDVWSHRVGLGELDMRVTPAEFARLRASGLDFAVLIDDVQAKIDAERPAALDRGANFFADYRQYPDIVARMEALVATRPDLASMVFVGTSLQGREIRGIRIGANPGRPNVVLNGCQHAREWISPATMTFLADALVTRYNADPDIRRMVDGVEFIIVPVLNPDGYAYSFSTQRLWRKNRRVNGDGSFGVDLNRNWGYEWGGAGASATPSNDTYRGSSPFSEPESQAMRDLLLALPNLATHLDVHSYSQLVLSPWAHTAGATPDAALIADIARDIELGFEAPYGTPFTSGPTAQILYEAAGSSTDWVYGALNRFAWGVELRDTGVNGFILPASQIIPSGEEVVSAVNALVDRVLEPLASAGAELPRYAPPDAPIPLSIEIDAIFGATIDPASVRAFSRLAGSAGPFAETPLSPGAPGTFAGALPAADCGAEVEVFVQASTTTGVTQTFPADAPTGAYTVAVALTETRFDDDAETDAGWTVGAPGDSATTGVWVRVDPNGTANQPEDDSSADGTRCWVTGNGAPGGSAGSQDIDGGATTLLSPLFDCSGPGDWFVGYDRWYSETEPAIANVDNLTVSISNNGGSSWTTLEVVATSSPQWTRREFRVADFLPATSAMRLRFVAADNGTGHIVEAAIDEVVAFSARCPLVSNTPDLDADGQVGAADLAALLGAWGPCGDPCPADLDGDGQVGAADLAAVLGAWGG